MTLAIEQLEDPLVSPLLELCKSAANADIAQIMAALGLVPEDVIAKVVSRPLTPETLDAELPVLSCYRIAQQGQRTTFAHLDHLVTLRLHYVAPSTSREQLEERWPLLEQTWQAIFGAISAGRHEAHSENGAVLEEAGVVWTSENYVKREGFLSNGAVAYPQFEADVQVLWRDLGEGDASALYPVLSLDARLTQDGEGEAGAEPAFEVRFTAYTPEGEDERDGEPFEELSNP